MIAQRILGVDRDEIMVDQKTYAGRVARGARVKQLLDTKQAANRSVIHSRLNSATELTIDDSDYGTDPYNRTGRFTVLKRD